MGAINGAGEGPVSRTGLSPSQPGPAQNPSVVLTRWGSEAAMQDGIFICIPAADFGRKNSNLALNAWEGLILSWRLARDCKQKA